MSKLDAFVDSKFMRALQRAGAAIQANKAISAVSGSMMLSIGIIMAGSIFTMLATLLYLVGVVQTSDPLYSFLTMPNGVTLGFIGAIVAFSVGYIYSKNLGMKGDVANGIVCLVLFLIVAAPIQSVTLEDGSSMSVLSTSYLGASGMFPAILVSLVTVRLIQLFQDHNVTIKLPDVVPPFLADGFTTLIPLMVCVLLWGGVSVLCQSVMNAPLPGVIIGILTVPMSGLISVPGIIILKLIATILWSFGIHGAAAVSVVTLPITFQMYQINAELFAAGEPMQFSPVFLNSVNGSCGNVLLGLVILCMFRARSQQLKAIGKASVVPTLFNITEPVTFGVPLMGNILLLVPQLIIGVIYPLLAYAGYMIGFFQPGHIMLLMNMPFGLQEFLPTMAWQNLLLAPLGTLLGLIIFFPFFKAYDRQLVAAEESELASAEAETA